MQKNTWKLLLLVALVFVVVIPAGRAQNAKHSLGASPAPKGQALTDEVKYSTCPGCWNPDSLGNHRALIQFSGSGTIARVIIPWRRRDHSPEKKRIIVQDAQTGKKVLNATPGNITRESGEIFFEPVSGAGAYYIYYMPYRNEGRSNYPKGVYPRPDTTASAEWLSRLRVKEVVTPASRGSAGTQGTYPGAAAIPVNCTVTGLQSIDEFNSFYPMEVIATAAETARLRSKNAGKAFLVFPEDRLHSIRMRYDLPYR